MNDKKPTAGIIMAAGQSSRFGSSKLLQKIDGKAILQRVIDASVNSNLNKTILVLGHDHENILSEMNDIKNTPGLHIEFNQKYIEGMSESVKLGLSKVKDEFRSVMFLLGDQPMMDSSVINLLLKRFLESEKGICAPFFEGKRKNPAIFSNKYYNELMKVEGDKGARDIIQANRQDLLLVEVKDFLTLVDIDTEEDLKKLKDNIQK